MKSNLWIHFTRKKRIFRVLSLVLCCLCLTMAASGSTFAQSTHASHAFLQAGVQTQGHDYDNKYASQEGCWDEGHDTGQNGTSKDTDQQINWWGPKIDANYTTTDTNKSHVVELTLWESPKCQTEWAEVVVTDGTKLPLVAEICKQAGPDDQTPPASVPTTLTANTCYWSSLVTDNHVVSPMAYSPNDQSQAVAVIGFDIGVKNVGAVGNVVVIASAWA